MSGYVAGGFGVSVFVFILLFLIIHLLIWLVIGEVLKTQMKKDLINKNISQQMYYKSFHTRKRRFVAIMYNASMLFVCVGLIVANVMFSLHNMNETAGTLPDTNWVEEDLEPVFMTTGVCVLNTEHEECHAYYDVSANGFYYRVHYEVRHSRNWDFCWKYESYIQISEGEIEL